MAGQDRARALHEYEAKALEHLWTHGGDAPWSELTGGLLKVFASGHGSTLVDVHGREYLDGLSGLFVVNVGHGRREIAEAMAEQAATLAYAASSHYGTTASVDLAERVASLTPDGLDRILFCSGGSEAVESALKIAKQVQFLRGFPRRYKVISRRGSYHGMTWGAMSVTTSTSQTYFSPLVPGASHVPSPNRYRNDFGLEGEDGDLACARALEQEIVTQDPETVAAFIAEPISVSNGTHIPSPAYWQAVREICDRHGVLLILDEVITGLGRTGDWFGAQRFGVTPDLMTMAKGLTSGYAAAAAVAVDENLFEEFSQRDAPLAHLLTFGGQAVAMAAAKANLAIIEREQLVDEAAEKGRHLFEQASRLATHPTVGDVRGGVGLMCAIDLVRDKQTKESWGAAHPFTKALRAEVAGRGLVTRVWDALHFAPPFVITRDEIDRMIAIVDEALTAVEARFA